VNILFLEYALILNRLRRIAFGVDHAQKAEGLLARIAQLMHQTGRNVEHIAETDALPLVAGQRLTFAAQHDDDVFVLMRFAGGEAAGLDLEIANVKFRLFPAHTREVDPAHTAEMIGGGFVIDVGSQVPVKVASVS